MISLNIRKLERKLEKRELSARADFQYLLTYLVFFTVLFFIPKDSTFPFDYWNFTEFILVLIIIILGTKQLYEINEKGGNFQFLKRFFSLSFVIGLWVLILFSLIVLAYKIIMFIIPIELFTSINGLMETDLAQFIIVPVLVILFFYFMKKSFSRINSFPTD